jgi:uncharacterized protein (UPF0261 family)
MSRLLQLRAVVRGVVLRGGDSDAFSSHAQPLDVRVAAEDFAAAAQAACRRMIHDKDEDAAAQQMGVALQLTLRNADSP